MEIYQLSNEINHLHEMITLVDNTVKFNLQMQLLVLSVAIVIAGAALVLLAKKMVEKSAEVKWGSIEKLLGDKLDIFKDTQSQELAYMRGQLLFTEQGSWTPSFGSKSNLAENYYYRMGDLVILWLQVQITNEIGDLSGNVTISGLPFIPTIPVTCTCVLIEDSGEQIVVPGTLSWTAIRLELPEHSPKKVWIRGTIIYPLDV